MPRRDLCSLADHPVSATLWIAACAAAAGWLLIRSSDDVRGRRRSALVATALAVVAGAHTGLAATGKAHLGVVWAKGIEQSGTLFERWNTFSRVRVKAVGEALPFGWGFAHRATDRDRAAYLDIDADAGTPITRFTGDFGKLSYLRDDVINSAYLVQKPDDVAVVGVGGGRDVLSALYFGAKRIRGIELNPAIFEILTDKLGDFSGHLDRQPGVSLVNSEARSYLNHSSDRYDLIQKSLIDTWAATAAGGLTLTENRLYTVDAWDDFYRRSSRAACSRCRAGMIKSHRGEFYRLVAIAADALQRRGVPAAELSRHVIAVGVGDIVTVMTRPDAFATRTGRRRASGSRRRASGYCWAGRRFRHDHLDAVVRQGRPRILRLAAREHHGVDGRQSVLLLYGAVWRLLQLLDGALDEQQRCDQHDPMAHPVHARRLRVLHRDPVFAPRAANAVHDTRAARGLFQRHRHGLHAHRNLADAASDGVPWPSRLRTERRAVYDPAVQRARQHDGRRAGASAARGARQGRRAAGGIGGRGAADAAGHGLARPEATGMRILVSILLLAPPSFCMGMMFPLGLGTWRHHDGLLPFFWSARANSSKSESEGILLEAEC